MSSEAVAALAPSDDVRPVVRTAGSDNRSVWIFGGFALVAAVLLFNALNSRRETLTAPATEIVSASGGTITSPPPLALPPRFRRDGMPEREAQRPTPLRQAAIAPPTPRAVTRIVERLVPAPAPTEPAQRAFVPQPRVIEAPTLPGAAPAADASPIDQDRVFADRLANPSLTVPQGAVIPAVLETALDSTRPGAARAIVQRDVMGFDGTRVLIPRGSRLYGEYGSEVGPGQKRALIRWTRLTRPDAVIVNLDSPAADPVGRGGVEGKIDSHFFARFGGAILQSILDIGVGVATREVSRDGVVVALPGSTQNITGVQPQQVQPTLRVRQGTSVSVFVARDLDFSSVDG